MHNKFGKYLLREYYNLFTVPIISPRSKQT